MAWCRRSVAGISTQRPVFNPRSMNVTSAMAKLRMGQVFLRVLRFPLSAPLRQCSIHIFVYMFLLQNRTEREAWESNQESKALSEIGDNCIGKDVYFLFQGLNIALLILSRHTNYSEFFAIFFTDRRKVPPASSITPLFTLTIYKNHNIKMNLQSSM